MIIDAYCTLGHDRDECLAEYDLLRLLEENGVDSAMIAPDSRELAVANREGNVRIATIAGRANGKFIPAFAANPWFGDEALRIAEEAVVAGGKVLVLASHRQGHHLGDPVGDALVAWACERNIPMYAHASPGASGAPSQLFFLAQRFPSGRFLLGRGGTTDYAYDMLPIVRSAPKNVWYDFGFVRPGAFRNYAEAAPERFCFASCAPQNDLPFELNLLRETIPDLPQVLGDNFRRFLNP